MIRKLSIAAAAAALALASCVGGGPSRTEREAASPSPLLPGREEPPIYREEILERLGFDLLFKSELPLERTPRWWMGPRSILAMAENPEMTTELRLYAIDQDSGVVKWVERLENPIDFDPVETDHHVYYMSKDTLFDIEVNVHPFTKREYGELKWRLPLEQVVRDKGPNRWDNPLKSVKDPNTLEGWMVDKGGRWSNKFTREKPSLEASDAVKRLQPVPTYFSACSPIAATDVRVFVGNLDYRFYAVDTDAVLKGKPVRAWGYKSAAECTVAPVQKGETVYFSAEDGTVVCSESQSGEKKWEFTCERSSAYHIVTEDIGLLARKHDWSFAPQKSLHNHMAAEGQWLFIASSDHNLYCLDRNNGEIKAIYRSKAPYDLAPWPKPRKEPGTQPSAMDPQPGGPDVFALNADGEFTAFKLGTTPEDGAIPLGMNREVPINKAQLIPKWKLQGGRRVVGWGKSKDPKIPPNVYILKEGNVLAAVNEDTGDIRWEYPLTQFSAVLPSPRGKPVLYLATKDGWVYALIEKYEHNRQRWEEFKEEDKKKVKIATERLDEKGAEAILRSVDFLGVPAAPEGTNPPGAEEPGKK